MKRFLSIMRLVAVAAVGIGGMAALMVWLAGGFAKRVEVGGPLPIPPHPPGTATLTVEATRVAVFREVVGAIAAERETAVASMILGRVVEANAVAGKAVKKGDVLARIEDREHRARLEQAEAALRQAEDRLARTEKLFKGGASTESQLTEARTALDAAAARLKEARTFVDYATVRAPSDGVVIDKYVEVGDTVAPGQTLVRLFDRLRLTATVPESLQPHLAVGQDVAVRIDAIGKSCTGRVAEIVPRARAAARAFDVKVTGPCEGGVMVGMFGRLSVPVGERDEIRIPAAAVRRVGQVATVFRVVEEGRLLRQFVDIASSDGDQVTVASGLKPGDVIAADASNVALGRSGG